jgi:hypothetical protein
MLNGINILRLPLLLHEHVATEAATGLEGRFMPWHALLRHIPETF